jgi:hypothetical protein
VDKERTMNQVSPNGDQKTKELVSPNGGHCMVDTNRTCNKTKRVTPNGGHCNSVKTDMTKTTL